ncbi:MAG: capsule assembly Wzi family protein [Enterobacterales bacterium]|nr:capsule assembly Wzi family protein [Enterobacterales bacterium]
MKNQLLLFLCLLTACLSSNAAAAPWIKAGDTGLRADIQRLADSGQLNIPVATYPLMWASVASESQKIQFEQLTAPQQLAYLRIKKAMRLATNRGRKSQLNLFAASDVKRFSGFENSYYEKNKLTLSSEFMGNSFSANLAVNVRSDFRQVPGDKRVNFDQSYIAFKFSNWVVDLGAIDQWWGPGYESSLIMSNNARPLPAVSVRRNDSRPFESPWLSWIGPWTFSAQMAQLETERYVADAKLWSSRASFKPFSHLEDWTFLVLSMGWPRSTRVFSAICARITGAHRMC